MKFGSVAVLKGWLKNETIDFFLKDLAPENWLFQINCGKLLTKIPI
jgi:hypothetical protein